LPPTGKRAAAFMPPGERDNAPCVTTPGLPPLPLPPLIAAPPLPAPTPASLQPDAAASSPAAPAGGAAPAAPTAAPESAQPHCSGASVSWQRASFCDGSVSAVQCERRMLRGVLKTCPADPAHKQQSPHLCEATRTCALGLTGDHKADDVRKSASGVAGPGGLRVVLEGALAGAICCCAGIAPEPLTTCAAGRP
jgi:hypothetical protein